jgi:beta-lactamase class A
MSIFSRAKQKEIEDEEELVQEETPRYKKIRDLAPENKKKRKEPPKPWGRTERIIVLVFILLSVAIPGVLAASARNWKLPGLPRLSWPKLSFNKGPIVIEGEDSDKKKTEAALEYFRSSTRGLSGVYGLYVLRLGNGSSYGYNYTEVMQAASLIKLPIMAEVYREAESEELDLDAKVEGSSLSYRQLLELMGKMSNNEAQIKIVASLGEGRVQDAIFEFGMEETSLKENLTTPRDIGTFFQRLWKGQILSQKNKDEMLEFLTETSFEDWIAAGIPSVRVAHKYGREVHVVNDAGIVFSKKPFVLVIMGDGVVEAEADEFIPKAAARIYEIETASY